MNKKAGWFSLILVAIICCAGQAWGQFPNKNINLYIGYNPGGGVSNSSLVITEGLKKHLNQPVIINYRPGASQAIAADFVSKANPDGYSLIYLSIFDILSKIIKDGPILKFRMEDFTTLGATAYSPYALAVNSESPWKNVESLVEAAEKSPGKISYGSVGVNSQTHLVAEVFAQKAGISLNHIPFQGGGPADTALLGKHVDLCFGSVGRFGDRVKPGGGLRLLAVTDRKRVADVPDIPTMMEKGYDMTSSTWHALLAPKGLPKQVRDTLVQAFKKMAEYPQVITALHNAGSYSFYQSPEEIDKRVQVEFKEIREIMTRLGLLK
jgi:tripartite-type tricarboxylate transporter receptor subunit TctC